VNEEESEHNEVDGMKKGAEVICAGTGEPGGESTD